MRKYLENKKVTIESDIEWSNYTFLKMDDYGIWFKKKRQGVFLPWHKVRAMFFNYKIKNVEETKITVGKSTIKLISNQDIFEDEKINDKMRNLIQLQLIYINDQLYISKTKAKEIIKKEKFPMKINGRMVKSQQDLMINEKIFLGIV